MRFLDLPDVAQLFVFRAFMKSLTLVRAINLIGRLYYINLLEYTMYIYQTTDALNIVEQYYWVLFF